MVFFSSDPGPLPDTLESGFFPTEELWLLKMPEAPPLMEEQELRVNPIQQAELKPKKERILLSPNEQEELKKQIADLQKRLGEAEAEIKSLVQDRMSADKSSVSTPGQHGAARKPRHTSPATKAKNRARAALHKTAKAGAVLREMSIVRKEQLTRWSTPYISTHYCTG